jgi:hypothetical protein
MLFLGTSVSISAFPMLARIIHFKKLAGTIHGHGGAVLDSVSAEGLEPAARDEEGLIKPIAPMP